MHTQLHWQQARHITIVACKSFQDVAACQLTGLCCSLETSGCQWGCTVPTGSPTLYKTFSLTICVSVYMKLSLILIVEVTQIWQVLISFFRLNKEGMDHSRLQPDPESSSKREDSFEMRLLLTLYNICIVVILETLNLLPKKFNFSVTPSTDVSESRGARSYIFWNVLLHLFFMT